MTVATFAELKTALANSLSRSDLTSRIPEFIIRAEDRIARDLRIREMESSVDLVVKAAASIAAAQVTGTANAIVLTNSIVKASNTLGDTYSFTAEATNTSTVTLQIDSITPVALNKGDGTEGLAAGDIVNGSEYNAYFDGTRFRLVPPGGVPLPASFIEHRRLFLNGNPVRSLDVFDPINFWSTFLSATASKPFAFTLEGVNILFGPRPDTTYYAKLLFFKRFTRLSWDSDTNWLLTNHHAIYLNASLIEAYDYVKLDEKVLKHAVMYSEVLDALQKADKAARLSGAPMVSRSGVFGV